MKVLWFISLFFSMSVFATDHKIVKLNNLDSAIDICSENEAVMVDLKDLKIKSMAISNNQRYVIDFSDNYLQMMISAKQIALNKKEKTTMFLIDFSDNVFLLNLSNVNCQKHNPKLFKVVGS